MDNIIIRNAKVDDINFIENFDFITPISSALKKKSICNTSFVAEINQKVVGIVICEKSLLGSYDIKIIEVFSEYRKKGIGTLLIKAIENMAKDKSLTVYYPNDKGTEDFYRTNGFIIGDHVKVAIK